MIKICILVSDIVHFGGAERVAINLANCFCKSYEVVLVSVFGNDNDIPYSIDSRINVFYLVHKDVRLRYCYISACKNLHRLLNKLCPNITLLVNASTYIFLPAFWNTKTKCVACEHTNLKNKFHTSSITSKFKRLYAVLRCDKIVTLTQADKDNYIKRYNLSEQKVVNIYNWIEPDLLDYFKEQDGQAKKIISVGRFDPVKGYEMLVKVAKVILDKYVDWEWHIYGSGNNEYRAKIQQMINSYHLENRLVLKESVKSIYEKYSEYSFLVLTSYYEGLPMVLLEAKACGLPVVSFASPTGPDEIIVDGINGYLVPCYDIPFMIDRVEQLINNKDTIRSFSLNSHVNIEKFQRSKILDQWKQLFQSLIGE